MPQCPTIKSVSFGEAVCVDSAIDSLVDSIVGSAADSTVDFTVNLLCLSAPVLCTVL